MSELREAAQAVLNDYERGVSIVVTERVIARLRAALAQPEAGPVAWIHAVRSGNGVTKRVLSFSAQPFPLGMALDLPGSIETISVWPLYTHPPRDKWREAVHDELVTTWTFSAENKDDPRKALQDIINWHVSVSLDPAVSSDAQALIERGKAMRDEWRPASEPPEDLRRRVIAWRAPPQRKSGTWFEALYDDGAWITRDGIAHDITHWRDVTPPTTEGE